MVNKRGWMRIMEAVVAIFLLTGLLLAIYTAHQTQTPQSTKVYNFEYNLLHELSENNSLRSAVLSNNSLILEDYFNKTILFRFNFTFKICNLRDVCLLNSSDLPFASVYITDRIISSNLTNYAPKKLRLAVWDK